MSEFCHPDSTAIRRALERNLPTDLWARLTEGEVDTWIALIQGRCRGIVWDAIAEFAALDRSPTAKAT